MATTRSRSAARTPLARSSASKSAEQDKDEKSSAERGGGGTTLNDFGEQTCGLNLRIELGRRETGAAQANEGDGQGQLLRREIPVPSRRKGRVFSYRVNGGSQAFDLKLRSGVPLHYHFESLRYFRFGLRTVVWKVHCAVALFRVRSLHFSHLILAFQAHVLLHKMPSTLFGAKKSLAGTVAAILTGTCAAYIFWSQLAHLGDERDLSWLPGMARSTWKGLAGGGSGNPTFLPRLPNPKSTLGLGTLSVLNGVVAGVAEASFALRSKVKIRVCADVANRRSTFGDWTIT
ncbi:hypothetical protein P7C70_g217, partial [Phenoliferia sp. Uapishka_3]